MSYETNNGQQEYNVRLKIPVNTLMFCKPLDGGMEEFKAKLEELKEKKAAGMFELDRGRIGSLTKLREVLSLEGSVKVYPPLEQAKGRIYAGTQFDASAALIQIDITPSNPPQCFLCVYCENDMFRAAVTGSVLDMLGKVKGPA